VVFRVDARIPILRIAMIANRELGKFAEVPIETVSAQRQADSIGPVSRCHAQKQKEQPPSFAGFVANIEILPMADGARVYRICMLEELAIAQYELFLATWAGDQASIFRGTGLAFGKAMAAMKNNLHLGDLGTSD
jgi:hypothetical protein